MHYRTLRVAVVLLILGSLVGCAEFDRRGGISAQFGDYALFPARTKSHRLLRAYVVIGGLTAVARNIGLSDLEKDSVSGRLKGALSVAQEAYDCLYPDRARDQWVDKKALPASYLSSVPPVGCLFFDERMARLDYAIFKLAVDILSDPESQSLFADVRDRMLGYVPVLGSAVKTASKALEATEEAANTVHESLSLANSIIRLSFKSGRRYIYLAPIYRDALELEMRLVLDALNEQCYVESSSSACLATVKRGNDLLDGGDGADLTAWRKFLDDAAQVLHVDSVRVKIQAYPIHFAIVTRWIYYSCSNMYAGDILAPGKVKAGGGTNLDAVISITQTTLNDKCSPLIEYFDIKDHRPFTVSYRRPSLDPVKLNASLGVPTRIVRPATTISPAARKALGEQPPQPAQTPASSPQQPEAGTAKP
ncbi:MAG: hypothetical protein WC670_06560 [Pseudolabrys sp.]|jgi:hypothetical protein